MSHQFNTQAEHDAYVEERKKNSTLWSVITASSLGTLIEWYDFYIFGSLAVVLSTKFFPADNPTAAFLSTLATFAAGFVVRPFGALFFGRLGDIIGRKYTFLVTLLIMGFSTFLIGCIPSYETIGFVAPALVLILRLLQGLALGGEYGGAATYVAEYAEHNRRGYWTSWIQTTATVGLFVSLIVILVTKTSLTSEEFDNWGWRVPFWISILMVGVSYVIRRNMKESPLFAKAKHEGKTSTNPLKDSFGNKYNFKYVLLALFGAVMGQGVIWYTGQFYAMNFMKTVMSIDSAQVDTLMAAALFAGTPLFVLFGWLSDKVGRKPLMMAGMLIAIFAYRPIYDRMYQATNPKTMVKEAGLTKVMDSCKMVGSPVAVIKTEPSKDNPDVKTTKVFVDTKTDTLYSSGAKFHYTKTDTLYLAKALEYDAAANEKNETWVKYDTQDKTGAVVHNTVKVKNAIELGEKPAKVDTIALGLKTFTDGLAKNESHKNGFSAKPNVAVTKMITSDVKWYLAFLVFLQVVLVTMVYGPIAAFLVEMFPIRIRYTSMSLPYHIGNGVFGGLLPAVATYLVTSAKTANAAAEKLGQAIPNPKFYLEGLWYPIIVAAVCLIIGVIYLDGKDRNVE